MPEPQPERAVQRLLSAFDSRHSHLESFGRVVEQLIHTILEEEGYRIHSITHRTKLRESLTAKLPRVELHMGDLSEVPDIVGLRIITYFADDVDAVAEVIEREFAIDPKRSSDRRSLLDVDRFGYMSLHYIGTLSDARLGMTEYRSYRDLWFELQVRSILQHSWAEMEHDLGYKSAGAVPRHIRRRFSRLAGLLEVADDEFSALRDELARYRDQVTEAIDEGSTDIPIDLDSLTATVTSSALIQELNERVVAQVDGFLNETIALNSDIKRLEFVGVTTINELLDHFASRADEVVRFARLWLHFPLSEREMAEFEDYLVEPGEAQEEHNDTGFSRGISLFYLLYLLVAERNDREFAVRYFQETGIGGGHEDSHITNGARLLIAYGWLRAGLDDPPDGYIPEDP
jgi:putative GTP pyrophosphokinase